MSAHDHRRQEETGASAVEYGLLAAGVAGGCVAAVFFLGGVSDTCDSMTSSSRVTASCI